MTRPGDGTLAVRWPDGLTVHLHAAPAGPHAVRLECRVETERDAAVDTVGVRLMEAVRAPLLVDGYHSWDWAGVRRGDLAGRGWWGCIARSPRGGRFAVRLAAPPRRGALALAWDGGGTLDATTTGEPWQSNGRTGEPRPLGLRLRPGDTVGADPVVVEPVEPRTQRGFGLPTLSATDHVPLPRSVGWMSWNCLGPGATVDDLLSAARDLVPPGGVVLLDDGWMPWWGDWVERDDLAPLGEVAARVRALDRRLGLWIAPFLVDPRSATARDHADLLLRTDDGAPVLDERPPAAQHVLDVDVVAARRLLTALGDRMGRAGVSVLKLDFLYAGALPGRRGPEREGSNLPASGVGALRTAFGDMVRAFRRAAGDGAAVWASGAPAPVVAGIADACRSGGDAVVNVPTAHAPEPEGTLFAFGDAVVVAQERNLDARSWLWGSTLPCDVDAVTLGGVAQTPPMDAAGADRWLRMAVRSGGPLLDSDLPGLDEARLAMLRRAQAEVGGEPAVPARRDDPLAGPAAGPEVDDFLSASA